MLKLCDVPEATRCVWRVGGRGRFLVRLWVRGATTTVWVALVSAPGLCTTGREDRRWLCGTACGGTASLAG